MRLLFGCALLVAFGVGCGGSDLRCGVGTIDLDGSCQTTRCGPGTQLSGNVCILDPGSSATCGPGTELVGNECQPNEPTGLVCGSGTHASGTACVPDSPSTIACGSGTHQQNGVCVPDAASVVCGSGTHAESGLCLPDHTISCGSGTHDDSGVCLPDAVCGAGTIAANGACVPDPATQVSCGAGTHVDGLQCLPDVVATVTCGPGTHASGTQCLPDVTDPGLVCGAGTHQQNGQCLPDALLTCGAGSHASGSVCLPDQTLSCGAGTHLASGVCLPNDRCGAGTHDENGSCVADPLGVVYEVRLPGGSSISADGFTAVPVVVVGSNADGTPATPDVVLSIVGVAAGALTPAAIPLTATGGETLLVPCDSVLTPACLGSFTIQVALASAPTVVVGQSPPLTMVAPTAVGSATACLGGGNVVYVASSGTTLTQGTWTTSATTSAGLSAPDTLHLQLQQTNGSSVAFYSFDFTSALLHQPLTAQVYDGAQRYPFEQAGHPGMNAVEGCNSLSGNFQIEDLQLSGTKLTSLTATFEQHCDGSTAVVRGCVHFAQ